MLGQVMLDLDRICHVRTC